MSDLLRVKMTRVPFNYRPEGTLQTLVVRQLGPVVVGHGRGHMPPDMAEAAIAAGYAEKFNPRGRAATTLREEIAKTEADDPAEPREPAAVDRTDLADDDRPDDLAPVHDAG